MYNLYFHPSCQIAYFVSFKVKFEFVSYIYIYKRITFVYYFVHRNKNMKKSNTEVIPVGLVKLKNIKFWP